MYIESYSVSQTLKFAETLLRTVYEPREGWVVRRCVCVLQASSATGKFPSMMGGHHTSRIAIIGTRR